MARTVFKLNLEKFRRHCLPGSDTHYGLNIVVYQTMYCITAGNIQTIYSARRANRFRST